MSASHTRRHSSLGPRLNRDEGERRLSLELPEALRYDPNEEDEEHEDAAAAVGEDQQQPFMQNSVFGMLAANQSKMAFRSRVHDALSEGDNDDDDDDDEHNTQSTHPLSSHTSSKPASWRARHRHRLSENKLLRSLPGIRSKSSSSSPSPLPRPTRLSSMAASPQPSASPSRAPYSPPPAQAEEENPHLEAPFMSQMLQARARASIDSSQATITRPKSGRQSPTPSSSSRHASVALPEALKDIFSWDSAEEVIAEYPCWYLQSVLLEGYMYITQNHISFYAYLPRKSNTTVKSGHLSKRGRHNPQYHRYWFTLRGDVLSYYLDQNDPYFPRDRIDLRYGISAQLIPEKDGSKETTTAFSVTTNARMFYFRADSAQSAKEWVKQLQKVIFRSRNEGDSVKISIPIENVIEIEENPLLDFADTIRIKVIDNDESFAVDEYFFSFFGNGDKALEDLRVMTQDTIAQRTVSNAASPQAGMSTRRRSKSALHIASPRPGTLPEHVRAELSPSATTLSSIHSLRTSGELSRSNLDIGQPLFEPEGGQRSRDSGSPRHYLGGQRGSSRTNTKAHLSDSINDSSEQVDQDMIESMSGTDNTSGSHILNGSTMFHEPTIRKKQLSEADDVIGPEGVSRKQSHDASPDPEWPGSKAVAGDSSPDDRQASAVTSKFPTQNVNKSRQAESSGGLGGLMRAGSIPIQRATGYLRGPGKAVASLLGTSPMEYYDKVSGMLAGGQRHYTEVDGLSPDDHVRDPDEEADILQAETRFREHFALPKSERLVATYFAFLHRGLPIYGKIYIGSTRFCFRSLLVGTRTKLIAPFSDIVNVDKEKGFRLGYQAMVLVVRAHEEIFFEFGRQAHRDDCTVTILRAIDPLTSSSKGASMMNAGDEFNDDAAAAEHTMLENARGESDHDAGFSFRGNLQESESDMTSILFDDTAASMLDFTPPKSLRIVCLTIGSRGDVQPYIALCKGLIADGHRPKIVTHAEFGPWVKSHGIDFAPVGGNPADLMKLCVEHGMFTPKFMMEAHWGMRDWVRDLLQTSWNACKDAEVLIESPSAMAGIHIAEALRIPYFRAFTMPWTRTRAYPHAFAVMNRKMGGAWNYMTYVVVEHVFWSSTSSMINRWRGDVLGLQPTTSQELQQHKVPFLYNFSPNVVVPPLDFSEWVRVTGYWFLDEGEGYKPPTVLQNFIEKARKDKQKLVYIGFGSVVVPDSKLLTQNVVNAVLKANVRCILAKGWSDRLDKAASKAVEIPLPPTILQVTDPVPHDWLFKQVDVAVHHGGAGTTGASLRAGIPTIIHPFFGDQWFFSSRVQDLGVGLEVRSPLTHKALGRALWAACHDTRMKERAKLLGEQIRSEDGVGTAIKAIYRDMEYARTLIKPRGRVTTRATGDNGSGDMGDVDFDQESPGGDAEEWTLVENDSDPEAASPKAMMQPERTRSSSKGRRKSGLR